MTPAREWLVTFRISVARASIGFAFLLGLLGSIMTFVPGSQAGWFGVAATGGLIGIFSLSKWMRVLALALAFASQRSRGTATFRGDVIENCRGTGFPVDRVVIGAGS